MPAGTFEEFHETDLSLWYKEHFGKECYHKWQRLHSGNRQYFSILSFRWYVGGDMGSNRSPSILRLSPEEKEYLEKLYKTDKEKCQSYISDRLQRKIRDLDFESLND